MAVCRARIYLHTMDILQIYQANLLSKIVEAQVVFQGADAMSGFQRMVLFGEWKSSDSTISLHFVNLISSTVYRFPKIIAGIITKCCNSIKMLPVI